MIYSFLLSTTDSPQLKPSMTLCSLFFMHGACFRLWAKHSFSRCDCRWHWNFCQNTVCPNQAPGEHSTCSVSLQYHPDVLYCNDALQKYTWPIIILIFLLINFFKTPGRRLHHLICKCNVFLSGIPRLHHACLLAHVVVFRSIWISKEDVIRSEILMTMHRCCVHFVCWSGTRLQTIPTIMLQVTIAV